MRTSASCCPSSSVSAIERGELDTVTLSTLRAYVRALGGTLRVIADFDDRKYRLT